MPWRREWLLTPIFWPHLPVYQDDRVEGHVLIFWKNFKTAFHCWTTINGRMLDPTKKKIIYIQGQRRSQNKVAEGEKSRLESNPISARDTQRTQTKPCVHQDPDSTETEPDLPFSVLRSHGSAVAYHRDRGSGRNRPGRRSVWCRSSWRRLPLAPP